jgi:hypothetical protein
VTFKNYLIQWILVTVVFAVLAFLCNTFVPTRTLWPFGVAFIYLGVLMLLLGKAVIDVGGKK